MCEGTVYFGYRGGCLDFQEKPIDTKMATKLGNWINSDAFIGKMTSADWTTFCKFAATFVALAGCVAVAGGCGTAEVITIGGATLPCVMVVALLCNAHAGTGALLADRCHIAMGPR